MKYLLILFITFFTYKDINKLSYKSCDFAIGTYVAYPDYSSFTHIMFKSDGTFEYTSKFEAAGTWKANGKWRVEKNKIKLDSDIKDRRITGSMDILWKMKKCELCPVRGMFETKGICLKLRKD